MSTAELIWDRGGCPGETECAAHLDEDATGAACTADSNCRYLAREIDVVQGEFGCASTSGQNHRTWMPTGGSCFDDGTVACGTALTVRDSTLLLSYLLLSLCRRQPPCLEKAEAEAIYCSPSAPPPLQPPPSPNTTLDTSSGDMSSDRCALTAACAYLASWVAQGNTAGASSVNTPGSVGGYDGGDHVYRFTLDQPATVSFDSCGSSYDTHLRVMRDQTGQDAGLEGIDDIMCGVAMCPGGDATSQAACEAGGECLGPGGTLASIAITTHSMLIHFARFVQVSSTPQPRRASPTATTAARAACRQFCRT